VFVLKGDDGKTIFRIYAGPTYNDEFEVGIKQSTLYMSSATFRGKKVEIEKLKFTDSEKLPGKKAELEAALKQAVVEMSKPGEPTGDLDLTGLTVY